jgi:HTH-type transcriptional regulator/antitoxin HigA
MTREGYQPGIAIPPGETLQEYLDSRAMSQVDLAKRLGLTTKTVNEIINGKAPISPETALALESVFGTPARFWISLEANFRETKARLKREESIEAECSLAEQFPYTSLAKLGAVPVSRKPQERVLNLRAFFGVASLSLVSTVLPAAFRKEERDTASSHALASWLRIGELLADRLETVAFDERRARALLPIIRSLALDPKAGDLPDRLKQLCASCGISLVFVPHLPKTYVNGATKWVASDKVVIQLSLRRPYADIIWFNLFHELGHVLLHGKKNVYVAETDDTGQGERDRFEQEADAFASQQLVPAVAYRRYLAGHRITKLSIKEFARTINVHPCMVVGRLQHDRKLPFSVMNDLRPRLSWEPDRLTAD